jgi:hypothetical protein
LAEVSGISIARHKEECFTLEEAARFQPRDFLETRVGGKSALWWRANGNSTGHAELRARLGRATRELKTLSLVATTFAYIIAESPDKTA